MLAITTVFTLSAVLAVAASAVPGVASAFKGAGSQLAFAAAGVRPAAAAPAGGTTSGVLPPIVITAGPNVVLQDKLVMTGTVTVTCGPFLSLEFSSAGVQISEPAGHTVAHASGNVPALVCDGAPHSLAFTATAINVPFHPGTGQAQAFANACGLTTNFTFQCQSGQTTGTVNIRK